MWRLRSSTEVYRPSGQDRLFDTLKARKPPGDLKLRHYTLYGKSPDFSKIDDALHEVIRMKVRT